jgi:hypothetical protein
MSTDGSKRGKGPGAGLLKFLTRAGLLALAGGVVSVASVLADGGEKPAEPAAASPAKAGSPEPTAASGAEGANVPSSAAKRVALTNGRTGSRVTLKPDLSAKPGTVAAAPSTAEEDPISRAIRTIKECQTRFQSVSDYTCLFYKRERINRRMTPLFMMAMKERTKPKSIYFKFEDPYRGREAIYVEGRNQGRILAHDVGITKFLAGTMELDPSSSRAMEDNRHPISEAGIGALIDTVTRRWVTELSPDESVVLFDPEMMVGDRRCLMVESIHPRRQPHFFFHKVRLFIDSEFNLPIRFEAYDWPKHEGAPTELVEEYSYTNLKLNVGLGDQDFDTANRQYSFGRF